MTVQHRELASGRWRQLTFLEQMANIGSEVERFLSWRARGNEAYSMKARDRALELIDLTLDANRERGRLRELARVREAFLEYAEGTHALKSSEEAWRRYFLPFAYAARRNR